MRRIILIIILLILFLFSCGKYDDSDLYLDITTLTEVEAFHTMKDMVSSWYKYMGHIITMRGKYGALEHGRNIYNFLILDNPNAHNGSNEEEAVSFEFVLANGVEFIFPEESEKEMLKITGIFDRYEENGVWFPYILVTEIEKGELS